MTDVDKLAIASRLYVRIRHNLARMIDVVWLIQDETYAREIIRLARSDSDPELLKLAARFEAAMTGMPEVPVERPNADSSPVEKTEEEVASHYIGALR